MNDISDGEPISGAWSHLEQVGPGHLVAFGLVDNFDGHFLASEDVACQLHHRKMAATYNSRVSRHFFLKSFVFSRNKLTNLTTFQKRQPRKGHWNGTSL